MFVKQFFSLLCMFKDLFNTDFDAHNFVLAHEYLSHLTVTSDLPCGASVSVNLVLPNLHFCKVLAPENGGATKKL